MPDEWDYTVQKAFFCQGEGNIEQAFALWQKAASVRPLGHLETFNYLLCLRKLNRSGVNANEFLALLQDGVDTNYFDYLLLMLMLVSFEAGRLDVAVRMGVFLADYVAEHAASGANALDVSGEPSMVDERGAAIEERSGANIIRCLETLVNRVPPDSDDARALQGLLKAHRERDAAMQTPKLPKCPEKKAWWKFGWQQRR